MKHFALVLRNWDESRYGPLDESKIEAKMLFGKSVKGAYVQTGKAGHYKVRDWQGKSHSQETKEHDGKQALFNEAALANKKKAIAAAFDEEQQERRSSAATAKGPQNMDIDSILALVHGSGQAQGADQPAAAASGQVQQHQEGDGAVPAVEEASSSESEAPVAQRLGVGKKPKGKAKPKPNASGKAAAQRQPKQTQESEKPATAANTTPTKPTQVKSEQGTEPTTPPAGGKEALHTPVLLDGRGLRLKSTIEGKLEEFRRKLEPLMFFDETYNWSDKKVCAGRTRSLNSLQTNMVALKKKIDDSANKAGLQDVADALAVISNVVAALLSLNTELGSTAPKAQEFEAALEKLEENVLPGLALKLSKDIWLKLLETKCSEFMLFRNIKSYVNSFADDAPEAGAGVVTKVLAWGFGFRILLAWGTRVRPLIFITSFLLFTSTHSKYRQYTLRLTGDFL